MSHSKVKSYIRELRAPFFSASIVPIILGSVIAWSRFGDFNWFYFFLTLIAGVLFHAGTNVANDYFDHRSGNDAVNTEFVRPFTGGSRLIQEKLLAPREVLIFSLMLFALGSLIGVYLLFQVGIGILLLGIIGFLSGFFYSCPPIALVNRGVGEFTIGLNFGALMTLGAYYVQTGHFAWEPVLASLPISLLIALVVFINQFQDMRADAEVGKNHWVVRLGRKRAANWYAFFIVFTYISIVVVAITQVVPLWSLIVLLTLPIGLKAITTARKHYDNLLQLVPVNASTIVLHVSFGIFISLGYILNTIL